MAGTRRSYIPRLLRAAAVLLTVALAGAAFTATPATAAGQVGYVRLAHLSPDTPEVDVYLAKVQDDSFAPQRFDGVGYGVMSKYLALPVGSYTVSMRNHGDPESVPAVLTTTVDVKAGGAYTVAGVGMHAKLGLTVLTDDLSRPATGKAKVRVIQASVDAVSLDVALANGTPIATGVQFATTTPYQLVSPGTWTLKLSPSGSISQTTVNANLAVGNVYSLLVLDGPDGLTSQLRRDAGGGRIPDGGVPAGEGGTASEPVAAAGTNTTLLVAAGAAVLLILAAVAVRRLRLASRRP